MSWLSLDAWVGWLVCWHEPPRCSASCNSAKRPWHNHKPSQRSRPHSGALLVLAVIAGACQLAITEPVDPWQLQKTSSTASLRGLSPVDCLCAYVSGSRGTVLRTVDGGGTWESIGPAGKQALDFRSVYALDAQHAWIANAGSPAQIYRTSDGGRSWALVHEDRRAAAFFDAMAFCDAQHGLVFGDPIDGRMELLATADGGEHWRALESPELPVAQVGEAAFAASGTCLVARKAATFVQVTGGAVARCFAPTMAACTGRSRCCRWRKVVLRRAPLPSRSTAGPTWSQWAGIIRRQK